MTNLITVYGLVQGVGFRPYVKRLADSMLLKGTVRNTGGIVGIQITGDTDTIEAFIKRLYLSLPEGAVIERLERTEQDGLPDENFDGFTIIDSDTVDRNTVWNSELPYVPADIATCGDCESELRTQGNRRYRHPFISCAVCGPRYSIIESIPYDRQRTVMNDFAMCPECAAEYGSAADRRCYAQTLACCDCGPELNFNGRADGAIDGLSRALKSGRIAAIKDIGGYHFACDALNNDAVERLRLIKLREAKPFAVMFRDINQLKKYANVSGAEEELLKSLARPIVLLERVEELASSVCGGLPTVGAMLPGNPVQLMLMEQCGPLVMTSGNISGEPIITDDAVMRRICEENDIDILSHNRRILVPLDDSVARILCGRPQFIRRARGCVPEPIDVPGLQAGDIMAAGSDLKSVFAIARGDRVILSQHFGDMEKKTVREGYLAGYRHMSDLYCFTPEKIVCDMHPSYYSAGIAGEIAAGCARMSNDGNGSASVVGVSAVQHHIAHIMSVAAEHGITGSYTGIAMDGTGYGTDGAIWGGEVFAVDGRSVRRVMHLGYVDVVGGDAAAKDAELLLKSYLYHAGIRHISSECGSVVNGNGGSGAAIDGGNALLEDELIGKAIENGINTVRTSSMGRLFDAVSAMLGICSYNRYEGECAMKLEAAAKRAGEIYPLYMEISDREIRVDGIIRGIYDALALGITADALARGFHMAVVDAIIRAATSCGNERLLVSGGVFNNTVIMEELAKRAKQEGIELYWNEKVPAGDGGVALGQVVAEVWGMEGE